MNTIRLAKSLMKLFERFPQFSEEEVGDLSEVFDHKAFLDGDEAKRKSIMFKSSESKFRGEIQYPWDSYFGFSLKPLLQGKTVLDLGCLTGGRSVAWFEQYELGEISGIDIKDEYIEAAQQFAAVRGAKTDFRKSVGESLPFEDETFDAILTFDVLEHVRDVRKTLSECYRVLKPGGKLFLVFPGFFHPIEHHLSLVTLTPGIHWLFSSKTLMKAYCEILEERGEEADWYKRSTPDLEPWEKLNTINGTTYSQFIRLIRETDWQIHTKVSKPIGSIGRNVAKNPLAKLVSFLFFPLMFLPGLREIFLHRVTFILEK